MFENLVYDGIEDLLKTLEYNNKILVVATSKPQVFGVPSGKCGFTTLSPFSRRFPHF
ncbi:hypothetical protein [Clostridium kluyveri]|uniref:hypothetical protein n=1 Tax=Clostridium kluyveri TaxID=1534 RepID=UPI000B0173D3